MLGGQGIPLPYPQLATPSAPGMFPLAFNFASQPQSNVISMPAAASMLLAPGWWWYDLGAYCMLQFKDPVSGQWFPNTAAMVTTVARQGVINSDGSNWRIVNPKGMMIGGTVGVAGTGYVQASTVVTPTVAGTTSLWHAIVGGAIGALTIGVDKNGVTGGTNFTLPPTIVVSAPPTLLAGLPSTATALGGIQATVTCTVSAGAINATTVVAAGAGYSAPPTFQIIPDPNDPNIGSITLPALTTTITGSAGTVTAIVLDYAGPAVAAGATLTVTGAGSSATATAVVGIATGASDTILLQALGSNF